MDKSKYRIRQLGTDLFALERKFLWFWISASEYNWYLSKEDALKTLERWEANDAVYGRIVWP